MFAGITPAPSSSLAIYLPLNNELHTHMVSNDGSQRTIKTAICFLVLNDSSSVRNDAIRIYEIPSSNLLPSIILTNELMKHGIMIDRTDRVIIPYPLLRFFLKHWYEMHQKSLPQIHDMNWISEIWASLVAKWILNLYCWQFPASVPSSRCDFRWKSHLWMANLFFHPDLCKPFQQTPIV